ncbi:hypothetical protein [Methylorubrum podarium]|uniref:hypothetical protein n=1 Tax=Methylorubrum podarium TaxID=200476 RepID=UPI001EE2F767|nr:hypothetical protein [Methylorubrum podarium]GJE69270.1 hypothetical protein CHKEEEPN_0794 [Methylorubrum podarium]
MSSCFKVLISTGKLIHFTGSEIVALETAEWFQAQGHEVVLAAHTISNFFIDHFDSDFRLSTLHDLPSVFDFDFVWCQHLSMLPFFRTYEKIDKLPFIALVSLSPYEPLEKPDNYLIKYLGLPLVVNSQETADAVVPSNQVGLRIINFKNAAPSHFWSYVVQASNTLKCIAVVSNHIPEELIESILTLQKAGIKVIVFGMGHEFRRLQAAGFSYVDAVVTIGKTVPYAIALGIPVYMYDRFGGDGWLSLSNFDQAAHYNFSGRPNLQKKSSEIIEKEILNGFADAQQGCSLLRNKAQAAGYVLDDQLEHLFSILADEATIFDYETRFRRSRSDPEFLMHLNLTCNLTHIIYSQ